jgi:hypothetical protein
MSGTVEHNPDEPLAARDHVPGRAWRYAADRATISLAQSTQAINGQRGKGNNVKSTGPPAPITSLAAN